MLPLRSLDVPVIQPVCQLLNAKTYYKQMKSLFGIHLDIFDSLNKTAADVKWVFLAVLLLSMTRYENSGTNLFAHPTLNGFS